MGYTRSRIGRRRLRNHSFRSRCSMILTTPTKLLNAIERSFEYAIRCTARLAARKISSLSLFDSIENAILNASRHLSARAARSKPAARYSRLSALILSYSKSGSVRLGILCLFVMGALLMQFSSIEVRKADAVNNWWALKLSLFIVLTSSVVYSVATSILKPFKVIITSWAVLPATTKKLPFSTLMIVFDLMSTTLGEQYAIGSHLTESHKIALYVAFEMLSSFVLLVYLLRLVPTLSRQLAGIDTFRPSLRRLLSIYALSAVMTAVNLCTRIVMLYLLRNQGSIGVPYLNQILFLAQLAWGSVTFLIIPSLIAIERRPIVIVGRFVFKSIIPVMVTIFAVSLPVTVGIPVINILSMTFEQTQLVRWSAQAAKILLQASGLAASFNAACLILIWNGDLKRQKS